MRSVDHATACAGLAALVATADSEALHGDLVEVVRQRVFDTLGAAVAGEGTEVFDVLQGLERDVLPGTGCVNNAASAAGRRGILDEVRRRCAAARSSEVDDIDIASCTTAGCVAVPVALVIAAAWGVEDRAVLGGVVAGYEVMTRVGAAIGGAHRVYAGVWPSLFAAPLGAAATAARVLNLDATATANGLAIAAARAGGRAGRVVGEPTSRWLLFGCAAADGVLAALAARRGMLGDPASLETMLRLAGEAEFDASALGDTLRWRIAEVDVKPFCTARQCHSAVEAARRAYTRLPANDLEAVRVAVPNQYRNMIDRPRPAGRLESIASVQYQVAMALTRPVALYDVARTALHDDPATEVLMRRIVVVEAPDLTAGYPRRWAARVRLRSAGGDEVECEVSEPLGSAQRPLGWGGLRDKHVALGCWGRALDSAAEHCRQIGGEPGSVHAAAALALATYQKGSSGV